MRKWLRWHKILALMYLDFKATMKTKERFIELLFFPVSNTLIWGLFATYFGKFSLSAGLTLLLVNIFWSFAYISQSTASLSINNDVWSHSFNQIFASGINEVEYLFSRLVFSCAASLFILAIMIYIASLFGLAVGPALPFIALVLVTLLASTGLGILVISLFILLGREYAFLSWSFLQLVIMLSAPFFPVGMYPVPIRWVSYIIPHTWIFEGLRTLAETGSVNLGLLARALGLSIVLVCFSCFLYLYVFRRARRTGSLVKIGY